MEHKKCPSCSAPMELNGARDKYVCAYCGTVINIQFQRVQDKVFSLVNRAINALKEEESNEPDPSLTPEQQARLAELKRREKAAYEKQHQREMDRYLKYQEKQIRKMEK